MSKAYRQEQILKLLRTRRPRSQGELAAALRRGGVAATQVTLSRDLKELGLVKTPRGYVVAGTAAEKPTAPPTPELRHVARDFVRDVRPARNLLVVKTDPGAAATVGAALDAAEWPELVGSLAGDDTLLLICGDTRGCASLARRVRQLLGE